jgi:hypothetical protein
MAKKSLGELERAWASFPPEVRASVIDNLEFDGDAYGSGDLAPFGGEMTPSEIDEGRMRARAFRIAAEVLRDAARHHASPEDEAAYLRERAMALEPKLGAPRGPQAAGGGA